MTLSALLILFCILIKFANTKSIFDQSQRGELNVQVDLKNLHIVALMKGGKEEYVDYDYAYDYSEMTIKPQNGTTPKPLNITSINTVQNNTTPETIAAIEQTTVTNMLIDNVTELILSDNTVTDVTNTEKTISVEISTEKYTAKDKNVNLNLTNSTVCKKGFVRNHQGACEYKLNNTSNALLKLVKLSQKMKLRRENRRKQEIGLDNLG